MDALGSILLICDDQTFASRFKKQLFILGKYLVTVEPAVQAVALSLTKMPWDKSFCERRYFRKRY